MAIPIDLTKIHWAGLGIAEFQVNGQQAVKDLLAQDSTATVNIDQRARLLHEPESTIAMLLIEVQMQAVAGQPARPVDVAGRFEFHFTFEVDNLAELTVSTAEQPAPVVHPQLGLMLAGIAYSTLRGILWTRLAGTPLEGITLPIIEPRSLFQAASLPVATPAKRAKKASTASRKS